MMKKMDSMQTKDLVAAAIRNEILSGGIEAGEELKQELLAEMLGVSRMPVREALQMLEQEGFIERLPNRHMVVAELNDEKLNGIMGMLTAMETEILRQGMGLESDAADLQLRGMAQALARGNDELAADYELEYHYALVRMLGITYLEQLFSKALAGYVSYLIQKRTQELSARYELLAELNRERRSGSQEDIRARVLAYYRVLFDNWDRNG